MIREVAAVSERSGSDRARLLIDITRPRVMALVLVTGLPALWLGARVPSLFEAAWILLGTAFAGAASSALNAYIERDTDALMARTRGRPLPAAEIVPRAVLLYGVCLTVVSTGILAAVGGWVAASVGLATIAFYVGVYTIWLKPRTPQNIVIGGAAGATAPLIASAAIDGHISLGAWLLFLIIFLWTPPHFWAIALYRKPEFERAGFPMMPLVVGDQPTRWRSLAYSVVLVPVSMLLVWFGYFGWVYGAVALGLGGWFVWTVVQSMVKQSVPGDRYVFKASVTYLSLLFLAMLVDLAVPVS